LSDFDFDVRAFDADIVAAYRRACWRTEHRAAGHIKGGPVPGTSHFSPGKFALAERAADVGAIVVDGMKRA